jgi:hypothetical protein
MSSHLLSQNNSIATSQQGYQLEKKDIPDDVLNSLPLFPGDQSSNRNLSAKCDIKKCLILAHHMRSEKMFLNIFSIFRTYRQYKSIIIVTIRLASILRKLGTSTSGTSYILHNSREPTTMALYLNTVLYIKL